MKVVHITEAWVGGISTYLKSLINHQINSEEYTEISLIYSSNRTKENLEEYFSGSTKVKLYSYKSSRNPLKFLSISKIINAQIMEINPDIIHLHSTMPGAYGRILKNKSNAKIVYCSHGWAFLQYSSLIKRCVYIAVEKYLAKKTDAIINISSNELNKAKNCGIKCPINIAIPNGVANKNDGLNSNLNLNIDKNIINFCFIGRIDFKKGFDLIEPFFNNINKNNIHLYVIGDSEKDEEKDKYQNSNNITYLGWVDNELIDSYLSEFDIVIVPSRYEGFGLVAIEAMRNSKPIIVSNQGALPELVINGFNGYTFSINSLESDLTEITKKLSKESMHEMGTNAKKIFLSCFTEKHFCNEITQLYKNLTK